MTELVAIGGEKSKVTVGRSVMPVVGRPTAANDDIGRGMGKGCKLVGRLTGSQTDGHTRIDGKKDS